MPPKAAANGDGKGDGKGVKMYSADIIAAVRNNLALHETLCINVFLRWVEGATAFQHDFRTVLAKSKELKAHLDSGEISSRCSLPPSAVRIVVF